MIKFIYTVFVLLLLTFNGLTQHIIIPTGTDSPIHEIEHAGDELLILGKDGFFSKCNGDCDELIGLTMPGYPGYSRNSLHVLSEDNFYLTSHKDFPHHGYILKTENGGETWIEVLDTTDILFTSFIMFDENNGSIITSFYRSISTSDGGDNWRETPHGLIGSSAALKINDSTAIMGITERFNSTIDKGVTWQGMGFPLSPPMAFYAAHIDSVFAVTYGGGCYFTYNMDPIGPTWTKKDINNFIPFDLVVKELDEIYIVGQITTTGTAGILKTNDLGSSWSSYDTEIERTLYAIEMLDDSTALIGGTDGLLIKWNVNSPLEAVVGIQENHVNHNINLYPNPANTEQFLSIEIGEDTEGTVILTDIQGRNVREVYKGFFTQGLNKINIEISNLSSGAYHYKIILENEKIYNIKWIKI